MEVSQSRLDQILDEIAALPLDEREMILSIAKKNSILNESGNKSSRILEKPCGPIRKV